MKKQRKETTRKTRDGSYRVFCGGQNLLNHHTVSCKGAPVERVGPIRTEGAKATCYHASQRRGQQQVTGRGTQHKTKSKESITTCNLQGTRFLTCWTESVQKWKTVRGGRGRSWKKIRYCRKLFRDGNETEVSVFALADREKEDETVVIYCRGSQTFQPATPKITVPETGDPHRPWRWHVTLCTAAQTHC